MKKKPVVCILGMHRSGTSLLTKILNITGLYLGDKDILHTQSFDSNKKGHWENLKILEINEKILALFGGDWKSPPVFPEKWEDDQRLNYLYEDAFKLLKKMECKNIIWGFKEPRTCLTLPFWQKIIPNMLFVIPYRHPADVALSLQKRNNFNFHRGLLLYLSYWNSILKFTHNKKRVFVDFNKLFEKDNLKLELGKIINFINSDEMKISNDKLKKIENFRDNELRHHRRRFGFSKINSRILLELICESFLNYKEKPSFIKKIRTLIKKLSRGILDTIGMK